MGSESAPPASSEVEPTDDKPFKNEPFNAGVETDEASDPKKFIEQLTGKLGQSLRKYNDQQGQPDIELEKFAINSLLSATHTSEMNPEDQEDIIKKIKSAGKDSESDETPAKEPNDNNGSNGEEKAPEENDLDFGEEGTEGLAEQLEDMPMKPKRLSIFAPEGSPEANFNKNLSESDKKSIFARDYLKKKLSETFNQDDTMTEPMIQPVTKPETKPETQPVTPSRRNKPFLPMPQVQPDPKAASK